MFDYPPYIRDLAPSDFNLFLHLKTVPKGHPLNSDEDQKEHALSLLAIQTARFYKECIQILAPNHEKLILEKSRVVSKNNVRI